MVTRQGRAVWEEIIAQAAPVNILPLMHVTAVN
jgi:hypothetical protein